MKDRHIGIFSKGIFCVSLGSSVSSNSYSSRVLPATTITFGICALYTAAIVAILIASNRFPFESNTTASIYIIQHFLPGTRQKDLKIS